MAVQSSSVSVAVHAATVFRVNNPRELAVATCCVCTCQSKNKGLRVTSSASQVIILSYPSVIAYFLCVSLSLSNFYFRKKGCTCSSGLLTEYTVKRAGKKKQM